MKNLITHYDEPESFGHIVIFLGFSVLLNDVVTIIFVNDVLNVIQLNITFIINTNHFYGGKYKRDVTLITLFIFSIIMLTKYGLERIREGFNKDKLMLSLALISVIFCLFL